MLTLLYQNTSVLSYYMTPGLPYVKDRLLSCATKSLNRIAQNPPVEESISYHRLNPAWDCFPMPLSVVCPRTFSVENQGQICTHSPTNILTEVCLPENQGQICTHSPTNILTEVCLPEQQPLGKQM